MSQSVVRKEPHGAIYCAGASVSHRWLIGAVGLVVRWPAATVAALACYDADQRRWFLVIQRTRRRVNAV